MAKKLVIATLFFTIFLDFFNLGLIYPIFTSLAFEGNGGLIPLDASDFYKNSTFGVLIAAFPFGQFFGAPLIGQLSDRYGCRKLLIWSLIGTVVTLLMCALAIFASSLTLLILSRFVGGLMAGNMTIAYASLADLSPQEEKVKNFALIPLATGLGFALGPYLAGILADPSVAGPVAPFLAAAFLALMNLILVFAKFPKTAAAQKEESPLSLGLSKLYAALLSPRLRGSLAVLFLMISSNLVFVQFVGPFAITRFALSVKEVGYLYANIGIAVALGHLFLTRRLSSVCSPLKALGVSLLSLSGLICALLFSPNVAVLHALTFLIMLACAVGYTNAMALVSNLAEEGKQGEVMGVAVSIQSAAEFLPAAVLGVVASLFLTLPLIAAAFFALTAYFYSRFMSSSPTSVGARVESKNDRELN